jgi:hypothetical protein
MLPARYNGVEVPASALENNNIGPNDKIGLRVLIGSIALWSVIIAAPIGATIGIKHEIDEAARRDLAKREIAVQIYNDYQKVLNPVEQREEKLMGEASIHDGFVGVIDKVVVRMPAEPSINLGPIIVNGIPIMSPGPSEVSSYFLVLRQKQENSAYADSSGYVTDKLEVSWDTYDHVEIGEAASYEGLIADGNY